MPALVFQNIAKLDLSTVAWKAVFACAVVKTITFLIALVIAHVTKPKKEICQPGDICSQYGIYTIFTTASSDLAIGLVIMTALFPQESSFVAAVPLTFVR